MHGMAAIQAALLRRRLERGTLWVQVLESSSDGTLTHPALLKDRVTSPAGTTIAGARVCSMQWLC